MKKTNGTNLWIAAMWGHRESSLHAFQWSQVKLVERGWKTSNQSSFATLACWVINYQTYKLQRNCSFLQMIFCKGHCALTISYHFPWMRPKNSTRPLLLPGWYAISAKRPDISWWQSHLVDTPTTCRVCVGWWWIENWRSYNKGMAQTVAPSNTD